MRNIHNNLGAYLIKFYALLVKIPILRGNYQLQFKFDHVWVVSDKDCFYDFKEGISLGIQGLIYKDNQSMVDSHINVSLHPQRRI